MAHSSGLLGEIKGLSGRAAIYGIGNVFLKSINFFLLPLYTRHLSREDFGILAITLTVSTMLLLVFPLGLHGSLTQQHFASSDPRERQERLGTLAICIFLSSTLLALCFEGAGRSLWGTAFRGVPFIPFVRLAIWTAYFNSFSLLPLGLLQTQERPALYVTLSTVGALLNVGGVIYFAVIRRGGAYGYMLGTFLGTAAMALPYAFLVVARSRLSFRFDILKAALAYGLPLLPHGLAAWALSLSDRLILERYVPLGEVGLYLLAFQFGSVISIFAAALQTAWVPFVFRVHAERPDAAPAVFARISTYLILAILWVGLGAALLGRSAIVTLTAPQFHPASVLLPWMILGGVFGGFYLLPVSFLFLKAKTFWIPLGTFFSGCASIGLNLALVPRYGTRVAAVVYAGSNLLLFLVTVFLSRRVYRVPYEWSRLIHALGVAALLAAAGFAVPLESEVALGAFRALAWILFPVILFFTGFPNPSEWERLRGWNRGFRPGMAKGDPP